MEKYTFLWSNCHQLFYMTGNIDSYRRYSFIPFNRADLVFQFSEGDLMNCYIGTEDLERNVEEGKLFLNVSFAREYIDAARKQCQDHKKFFSHITKLDVTNASEAILLEIWRGLIENYAHSIAYFRSTQEEPSRRIVEIVTDVVTPEEAADLLQSSDLDEINKEEAAWEKFMQKGFADAVALEHIRQFPWLCQNALSYDETVGELKQRAQEHQFRDIEKEKRQLVERQKVILSRYPELTENVHILQQLALLRSEVKSRWAATGYYATPLFTELARRKGIDLYDLMFWYASEDIDLLLETGKILSPREISDRKLCTVNHLQNGDLKSFFGEEAILLKKKILGEEDTKNVQILKGISARPGKVAGRIHILKTNDPKAARAFRDSFKEGVLVTSMTQPNVVDIVRRASAIVTDEGGMLCHAAVISREFGIPCIVGTHRATRVLREGDLVEVDADVGLIRVLERA